MSLINYQQDRLVHDKELTAVTEKRLRTTALAVSNHLVTCTNLVSSTVTAPSNLASRKFNPKQKMQEFKAGN